MFAANAIIPPSGGSSIVYATWNPADKGSAITLSGGDLVATGGPGAVRSTVGKSTGKWYWEVALSGSGYWFLGVGNSTHNLLTYPYHPNCAGFQSNGYWWNHTTIPTVDSTYSTGTGHTVGLALDHTSHQLFVYIDNAYKGSIAVENTTLYPIVGGYSGTEVFTANFGATAFSGSVPSGFTPGVY